MISLAQSEIASYTMSLSQVVLRWIENKILAGELKTGDKINETAIAAELDISRAPIREAVKELQVSGLIEYKPRKSGYVPTITRKDADEIFDIRIWLEKDVVRLAIENGHLDAQGIETLTKMADEMEKSAARIDESLDLYTHNKMDLDFHTYLWSLAESPRRQVMLHNMFMQLILARNQSTGVLGNTDEKAREHMEYIKALAAHDIEAAQAVLERHVDVYRVELYEKVYHV